MEIPKRKLSSKLCLKSTIFHLSQPALTFYPPGGGVCIENSHNVTTADTQGAIYYQPCLSVTNVVTPSAVQHHETIKAEKVESDNHTNVLVT